MLEQLPDHEKTRLPAVELKVPRAVSILSQLLPAFIRETVGLGGAYSVLFENGQL